MSPQDAAMQLESLFRRVHRQSMQDIPIVNPALEVAAVGFRDWQGYHLGVMLTPWFMNLMLLPGTNDPWTGVRIGATRSFQFPSGSYEFLLGEQAGIGRYLACSLYSPVFEFEDQAAALATAAAVMEALFTADQPGRVDADTGARTGPAQAPDRKASLGGAPDAGEPRLLSRRAFLGGGRPR